jgi:hypothetical protein
LWSTPDSKLQNVIEDINTPCCDFIGSQHRESSNSDF